MSRVGVPQEDSVYHTRIVGHETHEVEYVAVVLGGLDADVMQRRGVAEIVLGSVGVGVEHILRGVYLGRLRRRVAEQVVEVRIDAQQQLLARRGDHRHEHLLALGQILAVGHRDLETHITVVEVVEDAAPEGYILVALDIDTHQTPPVIDRFGYGGVVAAAPQQRLVSLFFSRCAFHNLSQR